MFLDVFTATQSEERQIIAVSFFVFYVRKAAQTLQPHKKMGRITRKVMGGGGGEFAERKTELKLYKEAIATGHAVKILNYSNL